MLNHHKHYIVTVTCKDQVGIVAAISAILSDERCFITESSHYGDPDTGYFFMRTCFYPESDLTLDSFNQSFSKIDSQFSLVWNLYPQDCKPKIVLLGSLQDHCVNDLLYRSKSDLIHADVVAVISNHQSLQEVCSWYKVPFHYIPSVENDKKQSEDQIKQVFLDAGAELMVLARYMQILSLGFCEEFSGKIINIHHSFLPSFKGAKPYHRAHAQGVKLIGATAHYVTSDLDEGPIIEQNVVRVNHHCTVNDLINLGKDVEAETLSKAVNSHLQRRVFIDKGKTVVF